VARKIQIVIAGGGAAGLELATRLGAHFGRRHFDIILVEKNRTHIWKPLLHEVATGSLDANLDEVGYRSHGFAWGYRFFYGALDGIDRDNREVLIAPILDEDGREIMGRHRIRYDYLVVAVGSVTNDFGTPGAAEHCNIHNSQSRHCPWCSIGTAGSVGIYAAILAVQALVAFGWRGIALWPRAIFTLLAFPLSGAILALFTGAAKDYWR